MVQRIELPGDITRIILRNDEYMKLNQAGVEIPYELFIPLLSANGLRRTADFHDDCTACQINLKSLIHAINVAELPLVDLTRN